MRQRIIGVGSPETPTPRPGSTLPGARPFSRQGDHKGKGKMRVVNENDSGEGSGATQGHRVPVQRFPLVRSSERSRVPDCRIAFTSSSLQSHRQAPTAMFTSTPPKKPISPPPPGSGPHNANQSARSSGEESRWLLPPDFSYVGGHPAMTPMLVRTATNGTTPTIGVEPPSHSPTTEGEASTAMDSGLLTADGTVAHHDREPEEHEHHSPPETTTPQSYTYQPGPMTTPPTPFLLGTTPPHPRASRPSTNVTTRNGSASWVSNWNPNPISPPQWGAMGGSPGSRTGSVQEKSGWVPPPIVPLSPIPGSMSMDYKFNAFAPMSSTGSPGSRVVSPGNEKEPLTFGMAGMTTMGTGKFLSPAPLNRPISLFSDSDG
ncbi:hypothetical protein FA13DRAFT_677835 [Coprinellus micaceus]|uniref:Uncharacterized protein n=1 Tax=Coprinellus micaceus TaxID=71717 RepID=A0A4Y7SAK6_COPMI|nr:hypothetical protein FA13DRAFT_677835 [Coprinellus micaceus]